MLGVGGKTQRTINGLGITTVRQLAEWPVLAEAVELAKTHPPTSPLLVETSIVEALTTAGESAKGAGGMCAAAALKSLRLKTVHDLLNWKFAMWAKAILDLAPAEQQHRGQATTFDWHFK